MIRVALNHKSLYRYDRSVAIGPQVVRLRPAPHCRTPICSYSLRVSPDEHFLNWQQDPHSNYLARLTFTRPARGLEVEVDLIAEMTVINPFDFFLEPAADEYPFRYEPLLASDLQPFLDAQPAGPRLSAVLAEIDRRPRKSIDFLVELNQRLQQRIEYVVRMEPGVQTTEQTLSTGRGSCRDTSWLLVQMLRHLGLAARFVSGYLIQLKPDVESLDGPSGAAQDFTDLHAWAEVFLPGAGWIGLDPTSGLLAGEGHIPLACTPEPLSAAPIAGTVGECRVEFRHEMSVARVHEDPRVTKPYRDGQWRQIESLGRRVDQRLRAGDVRLTMGGEPTFVSVDDMESDQWKTAAVGPMKRRLAESLIQRLRDRFAPGALLHHGQGKWYPGEPLPRWTLTCLWRTDGQQIWEDHQQLADPQRDYGHDAQQARQFAQCLARRLQLDDSSVAFAYEDALYHLWKEQRLPVNADLLARHAEELDDPQSRARLARMVEQGLSPPTGCLLPLAHQWWQARPHWVTGPWPLRSEHLFLIPGDSPMGLRLPLDALPAESNKAFTGPVVPFAEVQQLPDRERLLRMLAPAPVDSPGEGPVMQQASAAAGTSGNALPDDPGGWQAEEAALGGLGGTAEAADRDVIRTAMCFEAREGKLHVFMPPLDRLESYLELLTAVEQTARELELPVIVEGYLPPPDYRVEMIKVTPDPGVIEVNVHPADNWDELVRITSGLYEDARLSRLGTEKFDADGTHTGTGGGNHVVMGAATPSDSPFLRRPDLLRSLIGYWHNHPSLSYLFSGRFIGPTSQAPRVDEGRRDATYELQIAFEQIPEEGPFPPWLVDRVFRHLLVDLTGNTHRAEFCIDKLFSPDSPTGRLGLVEFRALEMPPHWQMSLTQQLLLRALVVRFWEQPCRTPLVDWGTSLHDRWMLPHFVRQDFADVIEELRLADLPLEREWFDPHFEFRFPVIGEFQQRGIQVELRSAIEPWYVLGEQPAAGGTARYVDSSVERLQVKVRGMLNARHVFTCNGRRVPLQPTGTEGEYVAGVRYRAWQPPNCLHPTIPVDEPLMFDLLDTWAGRSIGGCRYHVGHPGGLNPEQLPVNSYEAESRRAARFSRLAHRPGPLPTPGEERNPAFPLTLDLRLHRRRG